MDETALAQQVGQVMLANDRATRETVGMELLSCTPGRASMRMVVQDKHLNGHQTCHGGFIFTLADSTFAFACNSHNHNAVAAACSIEFLKPAHLGDELLTEGVLGVHGFTTVPGICALLPRNKATVSPRWLVTLTS